MASLLHIAEIAGLLAIAFAAGWGLGFAAHRLLRRPAAEPVAASAAPVEAAAPGEPLVKAPVIVPVAAAAPAPLSAMVELPPVVAPAEPFLPPPAVEPVAEPAVVAPVVEVKPEATPVPPVEAAPPSPPPEPEPVPSPEQVPAPEQVLAPEPPPEVVSSARPAARPGEAWGGEIRGHAATPHAPDAPARTAPTPLADIDEDAAMRAIEGASGGARWQPPPRPADTDVARAGAAVAAAEAAVQQALAELEPKPKSPS